mmetsp:Transcript_44067/g.125701  ORF Transcript_44067/g.125701 Transcript_44067/m.125701 type:complete len:235 (-) Transcript_44067:261-965(-)
MVQVVRVEVVLHLTRERGLVSLALAALQHVVDLEARVVNLRKPLDGHVLREHPGVAASLGQVENHVLDQRAAENVVVLERRPLVEKLVVLTCGAAAVELLPFQLELRLLLGVVLLALGILNRAAEVVVVVVVLLDKGLPVLVGIQPLGLREQGDGRVLEGDPQGPRAILQDVLRLRHGLLAARHRRVKELPALLLPLHRGHVILGEYGIQQCRLLRVEALEAAQDLLVADPALP